MTTAHQDKPVAFITGASFGIGAETALLMAARGYAVAISATRIGNLDGTLKKIGAAGGSAFPVALDLQDQQGIDGAFAKLVAHFGHIDVLVNNAGANLRGLAVDVTRDEWDKVFNINVTGTFFLTQCFGRHLIADARPGSIVNIASTHGVLGAAERSTYGISKAALLQMTRMLAVEWAPHGIRVNAVAPGRLDTPSPSRAKTGQNPEYMKAMIAKIPLGRLATAEDVAEAVCYLAGPQGGFVTGHTLMIDGGLSVI